jgi:hypothetical protein
MNPFRCVALYRLSGMVEIQRLNGKPGDPFPLFVGNFLDFENPARLVLANYSGLTKRRGYLKYIEIEKEEIK